MSSSRIAEITKTLQEFVEYDEAKTLRSELKTLAALYYQPQHTVHEYMDTIKLHADCFDIGTNGAHSTNHPTIYTMFTVKGQHIQGNTLEECLDKLMD